MFWADSDEVAFHDAPAYFSGEEWEHLDKWQKQLYRSVMKEIHHALMSLGPLIATTVVSLQSKEKDRLIPKHNKDTERRHSVNQPPSYVMPESEVLFKTNKEETQYLKIHRNTEWTENKVPCSTGHEVVSFRIKCEEEPFCMKQQDSESSEIIKSLYGNESLKRQRNLDHSLKCDAETTVCRSVVNELKANQVESFYEQSVPMNQKWAGRDQELRDEEAAQWLSGCSQQTNTNVHQPTPEVQRSETYNICEWIMKDDHIIPAKLNQHQSCGSYTYSENEQIGPPKHQGARETKGRHTCSHCGKSFTVMSNLIKHERIHTGERPFPCLICEKSFYQIGDLRRHEKLHTGERPYLCNICGKRFNRKHHLLGHKKVHTKKQQSDQMDLLAN